MKLANIILKEEIKSLILEIDSEKELEQEINQYLKIQKELNAKQEEFKEVLDYISSTDKSLKSRFKKIQKYMEDNDLQEKKSNKWVAKLKEVLKYKKIQPPYKEAWLEALKKVNEATRNVMIKTLESIKEAKKAETKIELELQEEGIMDYLKSLFGKIKGLFNSFKNYKKAVNELPNLDDIKEVTTAGDIAGYNSKYFIEDDEDNINEAAKIDKMYVKKALQDFNRSKDTMAKRK